MIKIKNVSKTYNGRIKAIDNLSLDINSGEIVGFIGLNGAGKTTLIKLMTGVLKPDKGTITINNLDIEEDSIEAKKIIGYISDNPNMFLRLTGFEYINFIADVYDVPVKSRKKKIYELADKFHLLDQLDKPMQSYSHGTRQKMMVIATLVHDPKVLILDEALTMLDPFDKEKILKILKELNDKGLTIINISHDIEDTLISDKIYVLNSGKIVLEGTKEEVYKEEKKLHNLGFNLPFMVELSNRLMFYNLIDHTIYDMEEMVNTLWK